MYFLLVRAVDRILDRTVKHGDLSDESPPAVSRCRVPGGGLGASLQKLTDFCILTW